MMRSILIAMALSAAFTLTQQTGVTQTPPRDPGGIRTPAAGAGTGVLGGVVVAADNARPIRNATVIIIGGLTGAISVTSTDADGRFVVQSLPADRYLVGASKLPFLGAVAGAKRAARPGGAVALANGEKKLNVVVRLPAAASIAGIITDEIGQPAANVNVVVQQWKQQGAARVLISPPGVLSAQTDEQGRYRVFGLPPGEYVVSATATRPAIGRTLRDAEVDAALRGAPVPVSTFTAPTERYAAIFFPGTARSADATPVVVESGDERANVDFTVRPVRISSVSGVVVTADGQPFPQALLQFGISNAQGPFFALSSVRLGSDGRFGVFLAPGTYTALAQSSVPPLLFATATVDVDGADVGGLQLSLRPPLELAGQLAFAGASPPPALGNRRVPFRNIGSSVPDPAVSPTNASGAFQVTRLLPSKYLIGGPLFFGANTDSVTWSLQSVVVDGKDVTDLAVEIAADQPPKNIVVTYGDRWQRVSGRLRLASGAAASDYAIVMFPADKSYWLPQSRRILVTRPDTDGAYQFGGPGPVALPAGDYLLAAVNDIGRDEQYDPSFLNALASAALPITVKPGEQKTQDLVIK